MYYTEGMAIFIDILGTKNTNFEDLYKINNIFHKEINDLEQKTRFSLYQKQVFSFSDCAYIIYTGYYDPDKSMYHYPKKDDISYFINFTFDDLMDTLITFLLNGFLCRGGISIGKLYVDKKNNILFGPAINEAYLLEREAIMPRIIFNENLIDLIKERFDHINEDNMPSSVWKDTYDNRFFLNYMNRMVVLDVKDFSNTINDNFKLNNTIYTFNDFIETVENISINTINNNTDYKIIAKHNWQLNYLERIKTNRKNIIESLNNNHNHKWSWIRL
jgi:hypothetical protein